MYTDIQAVVIDRLKTLGWVFDRILTTTATKLYETAVGPKQATIMVIADREVPQFWLRAEYISEGRNALAQCFNVIQHSASAELATVQVNSFVIDLEKAIAGTYAARLLKTGGAA